MCQYLRWMQNLLKNPGFWCRLFLKLLSRLGRTSKQFAWIRSVWHVFENCSLLLPCRILFIYFFMSISLHGTELYGLTLHFQIKPSLAHMLNFFSLEWIDNHTDGVLQKRSNLTGFFKISSSCCGPGIPILIYDFLSWRQKSSHIESFLECCHLSPTSSLPYIQYGCS